MASPANAHMMNQHHSSSSTSADILPSTVVGSYEIGSEIGRGSFATVYLASRTQIVKSGNNDQQPTPFAVKSVLRDKLNRKLSENLESEIRILQGLRHPNIVQLLDIVKTDRHIHLIMEYCSLGDLSAYIKRKGLLRDQIVANGANPLAGPVGGLAEPVVRHFLLQLASAMEFLRAHSLIHRDLKPQNLLLSPAPHNAPPLQIGPRLAVPALPLLKLADFGFARALPSQSLASTLCGSPLYMAPEVLRGDRYDAKADLWSLGAILYEMLVGRPPFKAQNHIDLLRRIDKGDGIIRFPGEEQPPLNLADRGVETGMGMGGMMNQTGRTVGAPSANRATSRASPTPPNTAFYRNNSNNINNTMQPPSSSSPSLPQPSEDLKDLIRQLLKRNPIERMSFEEFFLHPCVRITSSSSSVLSRSQFNTSALESTHPYSANSMSRPLSIQPPFASTPQQAPSEGPRDGHPSSLPTNVGFLSTGKAPGPPINRSRSQSFANHVDGADSSPAPSSSSSGSSSNQNHTGETQKMSYAAVARSPTLERANLASGAENAIHMIRAAVNEPLKRQPGPGEVETRRASISGGGQTPPSGMMPHNQHQNQHNNQNYAPVQPQHQQQHQQSYSQQYQQQQQPKLEPPFPHYAVDPSAFTHVFDTPPVINNSNIAASSVTSLGSIELSGGSGEGDGEDRDRIVMLVKRPSSAARSPRMPDQNQNGGHHYNGQYQNQNQSQQQQEKSRARHHNHQQQSKSTSLDEYVVVEKRAVEVNWLADEVERMVGLGGRVGKAGNSNSNTPPNSARGGAGGADGGDIGIGIAGAFGIDGQQPMDMAGSPGGAIGRVAGWTEAFTSKGRNAPPHIRDSMHRFLDPPVDSGRSSSNGMHSSLEVHLVVLNRCARRGQAVHALADERFLVARAAAASTATSNNNNVGHPYSSSNRKTPSSTPPPPKSHLNANLPPSPRALAEEALALYLRALGLYQEGMEVARSVWARGAPGVNLGSLSAAVAWIRDRFNECLERAEVAGRAFELAGGAGGGETGRTVEKVVHERAVEMSQAAALAEINGGDLASIEAAFSQAALLLEAILSEPVMLAQGSDLFPFAVDTPQSDMMPPDDRAAVERFIASLYFQVSRVRERVRERVRGGSGNLVT